MKKGYDVRVNVTKYWNHIQTRDLMKKGLRLLAPLGADGGDHSNQRPDEEGLRLAAVALFTTVPPFKPET